MALDYTFLSSVVREKYLPGFVNNIFDSSAGLKMLMNDQRVFQKGGDGFSEGVLYAQGNASGTYSGYDVLDTTPSNPRTRAKHNWANYYSTVSISGDDEDVVQGEEAVLDLVQAEMELAEMTMKDDLADDFYVGGGTNELVGLETAVGTGTYGGIAVADFAGWVSGVDSTAHTSDNMKDSTNASYGIKLLQNAFRSATHSGSKPNLILTNLFVWDIFESISINSDQFTKNVSKRTQSIANLGYNVIEFRGVPIVADEKCPDSKMYVLNTKFMKWVVHPKVNFTFSGFVKPSNQRARIGQIFLKAQIALNNRRMHYAFTNLPTS